MLKLTDEISFEELDKKFDLDTKIIDGDYEFGVDGDIEHSDGNVFISERNREIYGIDCSRLDLLYDLIISGYVKKEVEENEK
ncbi:MAG: hypothetical protein OSJ70_04895 [Bacilli bacterium]|nr:hypothetical protein [Bacilli bacterium]